MKMYMNLLALCALPLGASAFHIPAPMSASSALGSASMSDIALDKYFPEQGGPNQAAMLEERVRQQSTSFAPPVPQPQAAAPPMMNGFMGPGGGRSGEVFGGYHVNRTNGYPGVEDLPPGIDLNGPNVIVVDGGKDDKSEGFQPAPSKGKRNRNKKQNKKESAANGKKQQNGGSGSNGSTPYIPGLNSNVEAAKKNGSSNGGSDLKKGTQVLIKNVDGRMVITPVPGTGAVPMALLIYLNVNIYVKVVETR